MTTICGMLSSTVPQTFTKIIDARSPSRYMGIAEEPRPDLIKGNISGSKNLYFKYFMNQDSTFKSKDQILEIIEKFNIKLDSDDNFVHYSGIGLSACNNILAFEIAGISNNSLYDGSWIEWASLFNPIDDRVSVKDIMENQYDNYTKKKFQK